MSSYILTNLKTVYNIINQIEESKITTNFDFSYLLINNDLGSILVYVKDKIISIQIKDVGTIDINFNSLFCQDEINKFNEILTLSREVLENQHQQFINDFRKGFLDLKHSLNLDK